MAEAATLCGRGCSPRCRLDGEAALGDLLLRQADILEPLPGGDADLRLHEVDSRDDLISKGFGIFSILPVAYDPTRNEAVFANFNQLCAMLHI